MLLQSKELLWSNVLQGYILGAIYVGYVTSLILGGRLAEQFGGKYFLAGSVCGAAVLGFLVPTAARTSPYFLIAVLIAQGIVQV